MRRPLDRVYLEKIAILNGCALGNNENKRNDKSLVVGNSVQVGAKKGGSRVRYKSLPTSGVYDFNQDFFSLQITKALSHALL